MCASYKSLHSLHLNLEGNQINASWRKRDLGMEWMAHDEKIGRTMSACYWTYMLRKILGTTCLVEKS